LFISKRREEKDRSALNFMVLALDDPMHLLAGISWEVLSVLLLPSTILLNPPHPHRYLALHSKTKTSCPIYLTFSTSLLHFPPAFHHHLPFPSGVSSLLFFSFSPSPSPSLSLIPSIPYIYIYIYIDHDI
jgi:hypothetical protein